MIPNAHLEWGVRMPKSNPALAAAMGKRMAARRKELRLKQERVAELAGITHQQYCKAEQGKCCFGADSLQRVCAALQVSADYLLNGQVADGRYQETLAILEEMTDPQIQLANEVLTCIMRCGLSAGPENPKNSGRRGEKTECF